MGGGALQLSLLAQESDQEQKSFMERMQKKELELQVPREAVPITENHHSLSKPQYLNRPLSPLSPDPA